MDVHCSLNVTAIGRLALHVILRAAKYSFAEGRGFLPPRNPLRIHNLNRLSTVYVLYCNVTSSARSCSTYKPTYIKLFSLTAAVSALHCNDFYMVFLVILQGHSFTRLVVKYTWHNQAILEQPKQGSREHVHKPRSATPNLFRRPRIGTLYSKCTGMVAGHRNYCTVLLLKRVTTGVQSDEKA